MKDTLARKVPIAKGARRKVYFDTQELVQNKSNVEFFPPDADRNISMANYISNSFPGEDARLVYGLSFELTKQFIEQDLDNNINAEEIVNAVKDAGVIVTADGDYKEFLRTSITDHFNFEGTHLNTRLALAGQAGADDQQLTERKTVTLQSADIYRVPDPFIVAPNQVVNLSVTFANSAAFPTAAEWEASGQSRLYMKCKLHLAELTPEMQ